MEIWIGIGLEMRIRICIGYLDWGLEFGLGIRIGIGDQDWGLGLGIVLWKRDWNFE